MPLHETGFPSPVPCKEVEGDEDPVILPPHPAGFGEFGGVLIEHPPLREAQPVGCPMRIRPRHFMSGLAKVPPDWNMLGKEETLIYLFDVSRVTADGFKALSRWRRLLSSAIGHDTECQRLSTVRLG